MESLHELLSGEGFRGSKKTRKKVKSRDRNDETVAALPIYICHDRRSLDEKASSLKGSSVISSRSRGHGSTSERRLAIAEWRPRNDEPDINDAAIKAVVSILSGYVGRYLTDKNFRQIIREKCYSCFGRRKKDLLSDGILANLELGIHNVDRLLENREKNDSKPIKTCVKLFSKIAKSSSAPNPYISACANLYLSIIYKLVKNDEQSAKHVLQVFQDSPFLAREQLLPELWEHFFLPHLLHIKVWYMEELEFISVDKEKKIKGLNKMYKDQMDIGTMQFAVYYKEWLNVGGQAPKVPIVPLPSRPSLRKFSESPAYQSLYQAVFGPIGKQRLMEFERNGYSWDLDEEEKTCVFEEDIKCCSHVENRDIVHQKQKSESWQENKKPDNFRFLPCQSEPAECIVQEKHMYNAIIKNAENTHTFPPDDLARAFSSICFSGSLSDCEVAIRLVSKSWLDSNGDPILETSLSQASVIEGIVEVLFSSNDDEVLELAISILAELVTRREMNRQIVLNADPQLDVFIRILRSSSLFLKAAILLYLVKPMAKQMMSMEWIPLVLRVLEFGDQLQTLFSVQCMPNKAAYYLLDQLLSGFDEDRNLENARHIVSLGGLSLLVKRMHVGDRSEKGAAASIMNDCVQADGTCRHYLAKNLKQDSIISLLVLGKQTSSYQIVLHLLTELFCLSRREERTRFLTGLTAGWRGFNTMHVLLLCLQRARLDQRPIVAVMLLQLDIMQQRDDYSSCSVYRDEAVDAIIQVLDSEVVNEKVQEELARALLILGGRFSYTGEAVVERWLIRKAGNSEDSFSGKDISIDGYINLNEVDETMDDWQRKVAMALLASGKRRLFAALSGSMANAIPRLARASLVTLCWMMSCGADFLRDESIRDAACSILVPQLIEALDYGRAAEERVLASFSLLNLVKGTGFFLESSWFNKELFDRLRELSRATWTAKELISSLHAPFLNLDTL